jgi:AcrR family transcriptional regulator
VNPVQRQARRAALIEAAASVFAERGYEAATTAEICRAAGVSAGNLFHYFDSKRAVFMAVIEEGEDEKHVRLDGLRAAEDPLAALYEAIDLVTAPATEPLGPPLFLEAMMLAQRDAELAGWLARDEASQRRTFEVLVRRATRAGDIDAGVPARTAARWLMAMVGAFYLGAATDSEFLPAAERRTLRLAVARFLRTVR